MLMKDKITDGRCRTLEMFDLKEVDFEADIWGAC